jgi:hypothetical protein
MLCEDDIDGGDDGGGGGYMNEQLFMIQSVIIRDIDNTPLPLKIKKATIYMLMNLVGHLLRTL